MIESIRRFVNDDSGVSTIEYGLIAALIAAALIAVLSLAGTSLSALWSRIAACLALPTAAACN